MKAFQLGLAASAAALLLTACGGGGGDAGVPPPVVNTYSTTPNVRYSDTMLITLAGSNLDQNLTLTSSGCSNFVRSTTSPNVSTATTAYYTCTVSGVGNLNVQVAGGGVTAATVPFTIAQPQVTMLINNGAGVSGQIVITLRPQEAPVTVNNFLAYVRAGFYNNVAFHRHGRSRSGSVFNTFVLQAGGYTAPLSSAALFPALKPTNAPITLEDRRGLSNVKYSLAMARTGTPDSATSQFFINTTDNLFLDGDANNRGYAVFGSITAETRAVVDAMIAAPCNLSPINFDQPLAPSVDCLPEPNLVIAGATQTS